ncbi:hypothetical protein RT723_05430 [Psychrosphaera aquimarina]|uniref:Uncharacterized protein n=1 Tax=Psychrosphaera aquimarina TaxID=2044854 RepID=A0ABU3QYE2_9GAMM|nr:hypothetical protein [Psychrosphaera aquimarina]MDU0112451.1 hypothetical protein [Psychrosphaera aquimarina]
MKSLVRFANICVLSLLAITNTTIASESNEKASAFELPHLTSGIMTSLSDYKGKVVYVDFGQAGVSHAKSHSLYSMNSTININSKVLKSSPLT